MELIYEGKAKKIFSTKDPSVVLQEFKDSLTAFNAQKKGSFPGKGVTNLKIASLVFNYLEQEGIPSHFLGLTDEKTMQTRKLKMINAEVVVRNKASGSLTKRLGIPDGKALSEPLVEFYYKRDDLGDPLLTDDQAVLLGVMNRDEIVEIKKRALKINTALCRFFGEVGLDLVDFKIEFGKNESGQILLADEISPDSCRLWDVSTGEKMDKDRFRQDLGKVEESYKEVASRIQKRWGGS